MVGIQRSELSYLSKTKVKIVFYYLELFNYGVKFY